MTKSEIDAALDRVKTWPEAKQEDAVRLLAWLEQSSDEPLSLSKEDAAALDEALHEEEAGNFASDGEIEAVFARYPER